MFPSINEKGGLNCTISNVIQLTVHLLSIFRLAGTIVQTFLYPIGRQYILYSETSYQKSYSCCPPFSYKNGMGIVERKTFPAKVGKVTFPVGIGKISQKNVNLFPFRIKIFPC